MSRSGRVAATVFGTRERARGLFGAAANELAGRSRPRNEAMSRVGRGWIVRQTGTWQQRGEQCSAANPYLLGNPHSVDYLPAPQRATTANASGAFDFFVFTSLQLPLAPDLLPRTEEASLGRCAERAHRPNHQSKGNVRLFPSIERSGSWRPWELLNSVLLISRTKVARIDTLRVNL